MNVLTFLKRKEVQPPLEVSSKEAGMTRARCQQMLLAAGLAMITRFEQVHALCEASERGQHVFYELYICQEDQLSLLTGPQFHELVQIAHAFHTQLHHATW